MVMVSSSVGNDKTKVVDSFAWANSSHRRTLAFRDIRIQDLMKRLTIARFSILIRNKYVMKSHITAVCGWFKSFLPNETSSGESGIPHHGSVWMVQVLSTIRTLTKC